MKISGTGPYLLVAIAAITAGCSSHAPLQSGNQHGPATELLAQAETLQQSGNLDSAIAQTERAVRIEPRNAYAWHRLAALHLTSGDLNKAEQFALRSSQYAAGNRELIDANQKLLDEVKRLRKKPAG